MNVAELSFVAAIISVFIVLVSFSKIAKEPRYKEAPEYSQQVGSAGAKDATGVNNVAAGYQAGASLTAEQAAITRLYWAGPNLEAAEVCLGVHSCKELGKDPP